MNRDCLYVIALHANYDTAIHLVNMLHFENFWKKKWVYLNYKTYFDCFSQRENFLLKENTYLLQYTNTDNFVISNMLTEKPLFTELQLKIITMLTDFSIEYLSIKADRKFIV